MNFKIMKMSWIQTEWRDLEKKQINFNSLQIYTIINSITKINRVIQSGNKLNKWSIVMNFRNLKDRNIITNKISLMVKDKI